MTTETDAVLRFENISKSFYGIHALTNVGFEIRRGEVHALLGENGAGKSTLLNILTGAISPDSGSIYLNGERVVIRDPSYAKRLGINKVHQELQLIPELTVAQNIILGYEPTIPFTGVIRKKALHHRADEALLSLDADFSSRQIVKTLSTAQMQLVEIAKALQWESSILALDEPTSSLTSVEIDRLFEIIQKLKNRGAAIIYVSHRLEEVFRIADRLTVLRDGKFIGTYPVSEMDKPALIRLMVGRDISSDMRSAKERRIGEVVLEVKGLHVGKSGGEVNFTLRKGEILGIAGLVGSGRTELVRALFGADPSPQKEIYLNGKKISIKSPTDAINSGIALIPEDRKLQGFVSLLSNRSNICLPLLTDIQKVGVISHARMSQIAAASIEQLHITPSDPAKPTRNLSGGNQQKVVLAKWLSKQSSIMIFDEPTRGIDVGAKSEIYRLIQELAAKGTGIIMVSSELVEIIGLSDRILVMHEGNIAGELACEDATEENILHIAMGGK